MARVSSNGGFTHLQPGSHTLKVRVKGAAQPNNNVTAFKWNIVSSAALNPNQGKPSGQKSKVPSWLTWLLGALLLLLVIGGIAALIRC